MNYLITAAGRGSRFLKDGIKPPKPLVKIFGNELLIWSMNSFEYKSGDGVYIVTLKKHKVKERLEKKIKLIFQNIDIKWLELEDILSGQLLTAIEAISFFKIRGPLIIHNCDTYHTFNLEGLDFLTENFFGYIPCFSASGSNWSFVKTETNDSSKAIKVKEKEKISNNCSVGTYIFSSSEGLMDLYEKYSLCKKNNYFKELFIAPIFQFAIENNLEVRLLEAKNVKVFGTPKELMSSFEVDYLNLLGENSWSGNQIKTLVVDIDKTLCDKKNYERYSNAKPIKKFVEALKKAHEDGAYIILFTSRNMRSFNGSLGLINKFTAPILINWLDKYKIPYDEIYYGKPWGHSINYIDDKSISIENFIEN